MKWFFFKNAVVAFGLSTQLYAASDNIVLSENTQEAVFGTPLLVDAQQYLKSVNKKLSNKSTIVPVWAPIVIGDIMTVVPAFKIVDTSTTTTLPAGVPAIDAATIQVYLDVINTARGQQQNCGTKGIKPAVAPVIWNDKLYAAAWQHSNDLAKTNTFSHTGSGTVTDVAAQALHPGIGSSVEERIEYNGYTGWLTYGENLAAGTVMDQAQEAIDGWLSSDGHCENLMNADFTEVGMAVVYDPNSYYTYYWTQNFGKR